jgi:hypothetical protein
MLRLRHGKRLLQPVNVEEKLHFSNIIGKSYSLGCVRTIFYCILAEKKKSSIVCITNFIFILEKKQERIPTYLPFTLGKLKMLSKLLLPGWWQAMETYLFCSVILLPFYFFFLKY